MTWSSALVQRRVRWPNLHALLAKVFVHLTLLAVWSVLLITVVSWFAAQYWIADSALNFRMQYSLVMAIALPILWFGRRWFGFGLGFAVLVFNLYPLRTFVPLPVEAAGISVESVSVLTYNVLYRNHDYEATAREIREADADIVLLLEVTPEMWAMLPSMLDYDFQYAEPMSRPSGVAVLSRLPLSLERDPVLDASLRAYLLMEFEGPAGPFLFLGVHTHSPQTPWAWNARNDELATLARYAQAQTEPLLIAGDLNVTGWSPHFQGLLANGDLNDARVRRGIQASWPTSAGSFGIPIDQAVANDGLEIIDFAVLGGGGSDHRALLTRVVVR